MRKSAFVALMLFSTLFLYASTRADFKNGEELHGVCRTPNDPQAQAYCVGYVAAIADVLGTGKGTISGWRACIPPKTTQGQVATIAIQWLEKHPENRIFGANNLVAQALASAFPCSK